MIALGIIAGISSALLQSMSYLFSAAFLARYKSPFRLLVFSHLVMGVISVPFIILFFPVQLLGMLPEFGCFILLWIVCFGIGQGSFFITVRNIEPSRIASLLGLKIIVLSVIYVVFMDNRLGGLQWLAVLLSAVAAVGMNWSGGSRFTLMGMFWLALTLVFYSLTDMVETHLVRMPAGGSMIRDAIGVVAICYGILALATLPLLRRFRWSRRQFIRAIPFGAAWYLSQAALFVCFGLLGVVFGNVIQSSRGLFSIAFGILAVALGHARLDARISPRMWVRRAAAAVLMAIAIILYSVARNHG
jgi:drug/metabolite transporter (DMT)-like permease